MKLYLDTHVLLWAFYGKHEHFSELATSTFEESQLWISPIVQLELQYLHEIKSSAASALEITETLRKTALIKLCRIPFEKIIREALSITWTRDPFDRLIVAQSTVGKGHLLTKDSRIHEHFKSAIW